MLAKRIIPCLDVKEGRVVKGINFLNLRDAGDPVENAQRYSEEGADEVVFLDITATLEKRKIMLDVVARTAEQVFIPLTVGGGVRSIEDIRELLKHGADKVSINTAAVKNPPLIREAAERYRPLILGALQKIYDIRKSIESSKEIPPCIKNIIMKLQTGEEVTHIENFAVAAYLLNKHRSVEEVLELFKNRSDYNEKIARYQVEHIAGLRGSKTKYKPPSCEKLRILGICVDSGKHCPKWIKNPLQYRPPRPQRRREPSYID